MKNPDRITPETRFDPVRESLPDDYGPLTRREYQLLCRWIAGAIRRGANRQTPHPTESIVRAAARELAGGLWRIEALRQWRSEDELPDGVVPFRRGWR